MERKNVIWLADMYVRDLLTAIFIWNLHGYTAELVTVASRHGTTTFIVDPHESANVSGLAGIDYILDQTRCEGKCICDDAILCSCYCH